MERTFSFANAADGIEITHETLFSSIKSAIPLQRVFITSNINRAKDGEITSKISKQMLPLIWVIESSVKEHRKALENFNCLKSRLAPSLEI